jgi:hypothetical protein
LQTKVGLGKGHGDGSLYLPLTLSTGNYKLRAYTSWMRNYGTEGFFEKSISVVNARKSAGTLFAPAPLKYSVAFFPEGGNLVENFSSKIGFKITDQYGRGIECSGVITEDDQDTVARFRPLRFGIGNVVLTPRPGHHYRSTVRLEDGTAISTLLPAAYKEGVVMSVSDEEKDRVRVNVQSTASESSIYLIAQNRQSVRMAQTIFLKQGKANFLLNKSSLGEGINQLTLFNAARQPICERLIFIPPASALHLELTADRQHYATRKKIILQISARSGKDTAVSADCSLSVFRVDSLRPLPAGHIMEYLWLVSELKGKIESPEYYFDHQEDGQAADNLMITQGWRRFRWEEVVRRAVPSFDYAPDYHGAIITGKIVDSRTGASATRRVQAYLSVPGTRTQFTSAYCDDAGQIRFELKDFYGAQQMIVQMDPAVDSLFRVDIANPFSETYTDIPLAPFVLPSFDSSVLMDRSVAMQVLNRYGGEKLKQFHFPEVDTGTFYYPPDYSYLLDNYTRFTTMEEVLREYVTAMQVRKRGSHFHLPLLDLPSNRFFENDPLILLDGVPIFNIDSLMAMDPLKIRKLETVQRKYFLGGTSYNGMMNWITYKGDLGGYILDPHATVIDYEGLQLQREFYSPSYETENQTASHLPDFRNVLYWSPIVPIDSLGKASVNFYSSDLPGQYIVVAEGIAGDGAAGSSLLSFKVD